ncbi:MAG: hypothetical protein QOD92_1974 [Acidimicrobiaceae bacterium]|jgi:hypothetical protein
MSPENQSAGTDDWGDDELTRTIKGNLGVGVDADLPDEIRFRAGVTQLIRKRLAQDDLAAPAVFLLLPSPPEGVELNACEFVPMLDNGRTSVAGRLWFVNPVVAAGIGLPLGEWNDATVFGFVNDELKVGHVPAILFEPRTQPATARFYDAGLGTPNRYEEIRLSGAELSLAEIFAVIDKVHAEMLVTPEAQGKAAKLWKTQYKHWASSDAEDLIQVYVRAGLTGAFSSCRVRVEQTQATGRLDLEIEESDPLDQSKVTRHAVLELKVLRSFGSKGGKVSDKATKDWVLEGVRQAAAYRDERKTRLSALCCFDMRVVFTGAECFVPVAARAKKLSVALGVWHLFASSKEFRRFLEERKAASLN